MKSIISILIVTIYFSLTYAGTIDNPTPIVNGQSYTTDNNGTNGYYIFEMKQDGNFVINTGNTGNATYTNYTLYDEHFTDLGGQSISNPQSISRNISAGTYHVYIYLNTLDPNDSNSVVFYSTVMGSEPFIYTQSQKDQAYADGNSSGYNQGHTIGYSAGDSDGYDRGYPIGFTDGNDTGYGLGRSDAIDDCKSHPEGCGIKPKVVVIPF